MAPRTVATNAAAGAASIESPGQQQPVPILRRPVLRRQIKQRQRHALGCRVVVPGRHVPRERLAGARGLQLLLRRS